MRSFLTLALALLACLRVCSSQYLIGTGISDVTGPAAEVNLMGYAAFNQTAAGIHLRLYSRAFIVVDPVTNSRVAYASVDWGMAAQIIKSRVIARLAATFGDLYTDNNVCISGTHSHSTPAGFMEYFLFEITSLGFLNESANAYVDGIYESFVAAHNNLAPGNLSWSFGELADANINRSPSAYLNNPAEERALYDGNTDYNMTLLKFSASNGTDVGLISWFAVHGTSMNNTNQYLSSDNKGYASLATELKMNPGALPGVGPFVAAFPSTNLGDVSPNINGTYCWNSGKDCDFDHSTCDGENEYCVGRGPGKDMFESVKIIGGRQADFAAELFTSPNLTAVHGPVDFIHTYILMSNTSVAFNGTTVSTCAPSMGYSFAAGTTDGPGAFNFTQGDPGTGSPFWNLVRDFIATPSPELIACQAPKPILLPTGITTFPYPWDPEVLPLQILRIGQFFIVAVPSEFTTMAGRRLRNAVRDTIVSSGGPEDAVVIISGLSNTYASYVTTYEEYQIQRYEGASTIYGPHTHAAYVQNFIRMANALAKGNAASYPAGPSPPDFENKLWSLLPGVVVDTPPAGKSFGDILVDASPVYSPGEVVNVTFVSANPRNDPLRGKTFLTVERLETDGSFTVVFTDAHYETRYQWTQPSILSSESNAVITWEIPAGATGKYRIRHFGTAKPLIGPLEPFSGTSSVFGVVPESKRRARQPLW